MNNLKNFVFVVGGTVVFLASLSICNSMRVKMGTSLIISVICFLFFEAFAMSLIQMFWTKCPLCKKLSALEEYNWDVASEKNTIMTEKNNIYGNDGSKIGSYDTTVDAVEKTYNHYMRCKYCGHECVKQSKDTFKK